MPINAIVTPGAIPEGACPQSVQEWQNLFAKYLQVTFPLSFAGLNTGNTEPAANMRSFPWYRTNADGSPDNIYTYFNGTWVRPHPIAPLDAGMRFYDGTRASLDTYDGGESGSVTSISGPMWQIVTTDNSTPLDDMSNWLMAGRMPVGVSANFVEGSTGGEREHTLIISEIPAHTHTTNSSGWGNASGNPQPLNSFSEGAQSGSTGGGLPHNNMPPYYAGYWIKRTARIYYKV